MGIIGNMEVNKKLMDNIKHYKEEEKRSLLK